MKKLTAVILALVLVFAMPLSIFAEGEKDAGTANDPTAFANNDQHTDVYLKAGDLASKNLSATVPIKVVLAVKSDKGIVAPANTAYKITNTGSIAFHVSGVSAAIVGSYSFATSETEAKAGNDTMYLQLAAGTNTLTLVNSDVTTGFVAAQWNANSGADIGLTFTGCVGTISADLTTESKAFTVTYTLTAGLATND